MLAPDRSAGHFSMISYTPIGWEFPTKRLGNLVKQRSQFWRCGLVRRDRKYSSRLSDCDRHYLAILSMLLIDQSLKFIDIKVDSLTFQILAQIDLDE
jgi:hypothetical protein